MGNMVSEEDIQDYKRDMRNRRLPEEDDCISKHIRDEAIKAWNFGKSIGLSHCGEDEEMVSSMVRLEVSDNSRTKAGGEKSKVSYP